MGQGCSSDLGVFGETKRRAERFAESPDLVMREIAQTSVSTIGNLRRCAHAEHFGTRSLPTTFDVSTGRPLDARPKGQDHLLFHNLEKAANTSNSLREITNSDHKSHKLRGGRGRKIAESFETDRNGRIYHSVSVEEIPTASNHSQHRKDSNNNNAISKQNISEAALEAFDVALSEEIARICPTRLWIRRRSFPKKRKMRPRNKKPPASSLQKEQRPPDQTIPEPPQVILLEEGKSYQRKHDYFGLGAAPEPVPYTPIQASNHIYAIRYSPDGCKQSAMPKQKISQTAATTTKDSPPFWIPITNDEASVNEMFSQSNMALPPERDVVSWTTISEEHHIYVVDLGLTPKECDDVVTTTEQECKGRYAAYTYAKQTLGCKEYPLLARAALGPVHSMVGAILTKFDGMGPDAKDKDTKEKQMTAASQSQTDDMEDSSSGDKVNENNDISGEDAPYDETEIESSSTENPPSSPPKQQILQLDDREPHIVKYDLTRKERQKLEMHTDKSEWTFLIALSNGCGMDYDGGGTYFECLDATVHIQKGHALVFPGRLRHKGQAIHHGLRFLLVGFLVDKSDSGRSSEVKDATALAASADSSPKSAAVCASTGAVIPTSTIVPTPQSIAA